MTATEKLTFTEIYTQLKKALSEGTKWYEKAPNGNPFTIKGLKNRVTLFDHRVSYLNHEALEAKCIELGLKYERGELISNCYSGGHSRQDFTITIYKSDIEGLLPSERSARQIELERMMKLFLPNTKFKRHHNHTTGEDVYTILDITKQMTTTQTGPTGFYPLLDYMNEEHNGATKFQWKTRQWFDRNGVNPVPCQFVTAKVAKNQLNNGMIRYLCYWLRLCVAQ